MPAEPATTRAWSMGRGPLADQRGEETCRDAPSRSGQISLCREQHSQALEKVLLVLKGDEAVVSEDRSIPELGLSILEALAPQLKRSRIEIWPTGQVKGAHGQGARPRRE